jgi:hypothetical protein
MFHSLRRCVIFLPNSEIPYSGLIQERNVLLEPWFSIRINGQALGQDMLQYVQQVQIEDEEDKLPLASLVIYDPKMLWINDKNIVRGGNLQILLGHRRHYRDMFYGYITHVDPDFPVEGDPTLTIVAIDKAIHLMDDRTSRTFKNAKVSDVVKIMLKECGLDGEVQDTGSVIDYIPQENETNLEFITRWRKKLMWRFFKTSAGTYYFGQERTNYGVLKTLGYKTGGMEIVSFTPSYQDHETSEEENQVSDIDNSGSIAEYTVRDTNKAVVYPGLNDSSQPVGKV